ncbi:Hypothetical protein CAP_6214 [Chondromyces apiculatus DSM 436]|uniref:Uncharacterized protein n=1 Tax=Chondromyces apiculatus DSM 436 TaxID=1192034 RepID=A0A017T2Q2_9BACT|nr:Hypothetical protein CAP_6214 [Chondromyces apiculatus DSM 436]
MEAVISPRMRDDLPSVVARQGLLRQPARTDGSDLAPS